MRSTPSWKLLFILIFLILGVILARTLFVGQQADPLSQEESPSPSPSFQESAPTYSAIEGESGPEASGWTRLDSEFSAIDTKVPIATDDSRVLPQAPFLVDGCEGEGCGYVESLTLSCDSQFFTDPGPSRALKFSLPSGTRLAQARVFTLILRPGSVILSRERKRILLLKKVTDEEWLTWEDEDFGSWNSKTDEGASKFRAPVRESWIYVSDGEGRRGWARLAQEPYSCPLRSAGPQSSSSGRPR